MSAGHIGHGPYAIAVVARAKHPLLQRHNVRRHLHNGAGSLGGEVPEMKDYVGNFLKVPEGREYLVRVPGSANAPLADEELANLLNWVLLTIAGESTPMGFTPYTGEEVGLLRAKSLTNVVALRSSLVKKINKTSN